MFLIFCSLINLFIPESETLDKLDEFKIEADSLNLLKFKGGTFETFLTEGKSIIVSFLSFFS
jgi:hypothetical protein